jgi:capsid protein
MHSPGTILDSTGTPYPTAPTFEVSNYEGATIGCLGTWGMDIGGPIKSLYSSLTTLRGRARDAYRNNPLTHGGVDSYVSNLVGTDISPRWQLENSEQKEELQGLWADSISEMDFYGTSDFYGLQESVCRSVVTDGEVLARFVDVPQSSGLLVPLQVQLLEADHLDPASLSGNEIRYRIEWKGGKRHAYWNDAEHPGER